MLLLTGLCFVALTVLLYFMSYYLLRVRRLEKYEVNAVYLNKEFSLFPSSYDYSYPKDHELYKGFALEWLWFYVSFKVMNNDSDIS